MEIKCLGGVNEIGGNKILLEHKNTRIFLDFGMSFKQISKYFSEYLNPRKSRSLIDFLEMDLLPDLKGIYREDYLYHMGRKDENKEIDAVFLTHAHADHAQYIHFLREDIPIYCTKTTYQMLKVIEDTGIGSFQDLVTISPTFDFYKNKNGGLSKINRSKKGYIKNRKFNIMKDEEIIKIKDLKIEMINVDHSLPGSCGFIVYSDVGNLVYTGDIRFHGYHEEDSKKFIEKSKKANPRWLISEGTRIDSDDKDSEKKVNSVISNYISKSSGLVFVEHPIKDLDRVTTIYNASNENKRNFVVTPKQAYLINELQDICSFKPKDVKILIPPKEWGLLFSKRDDIETIFKEFHPKREYKKWEQDLIWGKNNSMKNNCITFRELVKKPEKYVVSMNLWEINQLIDIKPKNAIWIKSSCEPFSDDMFLDEERKNNWLEKYNIEEFSAHASGHACGTEIKSMINRIDPDEIVPVHTEHPEMF